MASLERIDELVRKQPMPTLTPRSSLACTRHGVDPRELLPLPSHAFALPNEPPDLAKLRFDLYERARVDTFRRLQAERARISEPELLAANASASPPPSAAAPPSPPRRIAGGASASGSPLQQQGSPHVQKVLRKITSEVESMLVAEISATQSSMAAGEQIKAIEEQAAQKRREREAKARAWAEKRAKADLAKAQADKELEHTARKRYAAEMRVKEKLRDEAEAEERERRREAERREKERKHKLEERLQRQRNVFASLEEEAWLKQAEDQKRERDRLERLEREKQEKLQANARTHDKARRRMERIRHKYAHTVELQRSATEIKLAREEEKQREHAELRRRELEEKARVHAERQAKIRAAQEKKAQATHKWQDAIIFKEIEHDILAEQTQQKKAEEAERRRVKAEMRAIERRLNMQRTQRKEEARKQRVLQKIESESERVRRLRSERAASSAHVQHVRTKLMLSRKHLSEQFERMRQSGTFYLPPEMRSNVENPELLEFMQRCDAVMKPGAQIIPATLNTIIEQMQAEGKLRTVRRKDVRGGARHR